MNDVFDSIFKITKTGLGSAPNVVYSDFSESFKRTWGLTKVDNNFMEYDYQVLFPNGYGASIIKGYSSYGGEYNYWEVALYKNNEIVYENDFSEDVIGYLTEKNVGKLLEKIRKY